MIAQLQILITTRRGKTDNDEAFANRIEEYFFKAIEILDGRGLNSKVAKKMNEVPQNTYEWSGQ